MLSSVLRSPRAAAVNVQIMRAFVRVRGLIAAHRELSEKIALLESRYASHDKQIRTIFEAIRQLMEPPAQPKKKMGFRLED